MTHIAHFLQIHLLHIVVWVEVGILWGCILFNLTSGRRLRRETKAMIELHRTYVPRMLEAMEDMTYAVCPMCAIAAGKGTVTNTEIFDTNNKPIAGGEFHPDPEENGSHIVHVTGLPEAPAPCRAAEIRRRCRDLFEESMKADTVIVPGKKAA
jgi:hypothetical protein